MILHKESYGEANNRPLVLIHGLMGQGRNLAAIARAMASDHHVIALDLRNHGNSPWADENSYDAMADDVIETLSGYDRFDIMGHSMGGKVAMTLALLRPSLIGKLMIVDIAPVHYQHSHSPEIDALLAVDLDLYDRRSEIDQALSQSIPDAAMRAFFLHGLELKPNKRWQNNLQVLRDKMGDIIGWPPTDAQFDGPTLFVKGEKSAYVDETGQGQARQLFPNAVFRTVDEAGHWLHVEKPQEFLTIMREYFL